MEMALSTPSERSKAPSERSVMTPARIRELLAPMNLRAVAAKTGLHYNTIRAVAAGKESLSYQVVKTLSDYFTLREGERG